jgi:spore germination cell wall hydrolase CwlJ-like protein
MTTESKCFVHVARAAAAFVLSLLMVGSASAKSVTPAVKYRGELHCLATAIYFEARGESERGQMAVAEVILTRTRTPGRPKTICGVVYEGAHRRFSCQFSFACDGRSDVARDPDSWELARDIAEEAMESRGRIVKGATYFHVSSIRPRWASRMVRVARVGTHIFYRPRSRS